MYGGGLQGGKVVTLTRGCKHGRGPFVGRRVPNEDDVVALQLGGEEASLALDVCVGADLGTRVAGEVEQVGQEHGLLQGGRRAVSS